MNHLIELQTDQERLDSLSTNHGLTVIGFGKDCLTLRLNPREEREKHGEPVRRQVVKIFNNPPEQKDGGTQHVREIARLIAEQRTLLEQAFMDIPQPLKDRGVFRHLLPEINEAFIANYNGRPNLLIVQDDLAPEQTLTDEPGTLPKALKSVYELNDQDLQKRPHILLELNLFVQKGKVLQSSLPEESILTILPSNLCLTEDGHLAIPDLIPIETAPDETRKLIPIAGLAFIEKFILKRSIERDSFYSPLLEYADAQKMPLIEAINSIFLS